MADTRTDESGPERPPAEIHHQHRDLNAGWLRPTVFGMMDGLVSNFALIAGVAGASASGRSVTLAGLAGLVGGAFSMATGEYVSVQSQNESAQAELAELTQIYIERGVEPALAAEVARQLSADPDQALEVHAQEELGIDPHALPSPRVAAASSFGSFAVGALIPLLPYALGASLLWVSGLLAALALFGAGTLTAGFTDRGRWFSGARQLLLGVAAAAVTFGVGSLFHAAGG